MKIKETLKDSLIQVILIVFSVVLGLYLNERIEDRKDRKESDKILSNIRSELRDNRKIMMDWAPYHREIKKNLDSLYNQEEFIEDFIEDKSSVFKKLFTRRTFIRQMPSDEAWEIAKSHPLFVNIEYEKLITLAKVYNQQRNTFEPSSEMFDLYQTIDINTANKARKNLEIIRDHMSEFIARENLLLEWYEEAKSELEY